MQAQQGRVLLALKQANRPMLEQACQALAAAKPAETSLYAYRHQAMLERIQRLEQGVTEQESPAHVWLIIGRLHLRTGNWNAAMNALNAAQQLGGLPPALEAMLETMPAQEASQ